ncbi:MAG TPA: hypothetical protein VFY16_10760 [Gemmatimonadaceae bacterium]|nr:hypothetical protein [Gemmatimonadaceae bacterium]
MSARRVLPLLALAAGVIALAACDEARADRFAQERARLAKLGLDTLARAGYSIYAHRGPAFSLAYPKAMLAPTGELPTGNGQRFASPDGRLTMTALVDDDADTLALLRRFAAAVGDEGGPSTVAMPEGTQFVVSRRVGDQVHYVKASLRGRELSVLTFQYDTSRADALTGVIPKVASTFPR